MKAVVEPVFHIQDGQVDENYLGHQALLRVSRTCSLDHRGPLSYKKQLISYKK